MPKTSWPGRSLRARMRALAAELRERAGSSDPLLLAQAIGARLGSLPLGERDGAYDPENGVILVNSRAAPERQRFTVAHEVAHALLLGDEDLLSDVHDRYAGDALEAAIEALCNAGASELLIPTALRERLLAAGLGAAAVADLARRAGISASVAIYAAADLAQSPVLLALAVRTGKRGAQQLTVRLSAAGGGCRGSLPAGLALPPGHPAHTALETGLPLSVTGEVPLSPPQPAQVSAYADKGRVYLAFAPL